MTENNGMLSDREQEVEELKKSLLAKERELEEALTKPLGEVSMNRTRDSSADSEKCKLYEKVVGHMFMVLILARGARTGRIYQLMSLVCGHIRALAIRFFF